MLKNDTCIGGLKNYKILYFVWKQTYSNGRKWIGKETVTTFYYYVIDKISCNPKNRTTDHYLGGIGIFYG